ncbi:chemotaxis protein CheA [Natrarchaeobius oligotrophus]|uniref:Chemotaxis protein CheA n=1 Tax=Natrarchaeobius chitinivorans TaxID=1679083 RepID=A0A3N6M7N7_NATCH|nr:chemotaxis protein CheA [Natrarchaeobius chitinivorans]RQG99683.1 chemotaxis protein CheA [Natrarchaeobius chitinivorans]
MTEYWSDFVGESRERITELNNALLALERSPDDEAATDNIFRIAHTLKGNCGAAGLESASDLAHAIEDLLDAVRAGDLAVTADVMDDVFTAVDELERMVDELEASGSIETDPSPTIRTLRDHLDTAPISSVDPPGDDEIESVLSRFEPPRDDGHDAYLARIAIAASDAETRSRDNGALVVDALIDAFDLIGTVPARGRIEDGSYGGRFDAVFGCAVGEAAITSGLESVEEVADFEIVAVTDRLTSIAADAGPTPSVETGRLDDDVSGATISSDEAKSLGVDDLLSEFDEFDDLDEKVKEVEADDDLDVFDEMGDAGSFDDLFADAEDSSSDVAPEESVATDAEDDEVEDAEAVFAELKAEVDTVGFDELQEELEELEFDEFDDEEEVSMDELLGDDFADDDSEAELEESVENVGSGAEFEEDVEVDAASDDDAGSGDDATADDPVSDDELDEFLLGSSDDGGDVGETTAEADSEPAADVAGSVGAKANASVDAESGEADDAESDEIDDVESTTGADESTSEADESVTDRDLETAAESEWKSVVDSESSIESDEPVDDVESADGERDQFDDSDEEAEDAEDATGELEDADEQRFQEFDESATPDSEASSTDEFGGFASADSSSAEFEGAFSDADGAFDASVEDSDIAFDDDETTVSPIDDADDGFDAEDGQESAFEPTSEPDFGGFDDADDASEVDGSADADVDPLDLVDDADDSFEETFGEDAFDDAEFGVGIDDRFDEVGADSSSRADVEDESAHSGDDVTRVVEEPELEIPDVTVPEPSDRPTSEDDADGLQSVRVDVDQIDDLVTLVEGLVTSRVRLRHEVESNRDFEAIEAELEDLDDLTTELQETVMDVRLIPLETVANRLPRIVRDIARDQDKDVAFELTGGDVELDRSILDRLRDPLIHLVRNAVDHGIEPPEKRKSVDKPPEGQVEVAATRSRDRVTITVADDGSGLDPDRLRSEAVDAGVLDEEDAADLSDDEAARLIFEPGLSTATEVTDVSGRGVGMDVVRRTIEEMGGSVSIDGEPGEGTTVTMTLPVSIAIDDVLFVQCGTEEFGIPTEAVHDVDVASSIEIVDGERVISDGERTYPVVRLEEALDVPEPASNGDGGVVVRIRDSVRPVALQCDNVEGQQEVVVKPFEGFMGGIPGLSGATVRGRGKVINIIDVTTL